MNHSLDTNQVGDKKESKHLSPKEIKTPLPPLGNKEINEALWKKGALGNILEATIKSSSMLGSGDVALLKLFHKLTNEEQIVAHKIFLEKKDFETVSKECNLSVDNITSLKARILNFFRKEFDILLYGIEKYTENRESFVQKNIPDLKIEDLDLSVRIYRKIKPIGINTLKELALYNDVDLFHLLGHRDIEELNTLYKKYEIPEIDTFPRMTRY